MRISFSPQRALSFTELTVSKAGDVLTINGSAFDFSSLPDAATIPSGATPCEWIEGPVERIGSEIHITLVLPHGPAPSPAVAFPESIVVAEDGPVAVPRDPSVETLLEIPVAFLENSDVDA